ATPAAIQALARAIGYFNISQQMTDADRTLTWTLTDGDGGTAAATATIDVAADNDPAVAQDDAFFIDENVAILSGNLFSHNGNGEDLDAEGDAFAVTAVNGQAVAVGQQITLASGALLTVRADGTFDYDPNGQFDHLSQSGSGAANSQAMDSFTYTITGGDTATVTITINGVASPGDRFEGDGGDNIITGTSGPDFFSVEQGGSDDVSGLAGNDFFYFGGAMDNGDEVDGGPDRDQLALQGNYAGLTFNVGVVNLESLAILPGNDTRFGDPGTNFYDYNLTTVDENVGAGQQLIVDAVRLRPGEDFTFNGAAESDGGFLIYGGNGVDTLTGGAQKDGFVFGINGRFGASDVVNGGGGADQLVLRGDYTITFGAGQLVSVESIALISALDPRFGTSGDGEFDYSLTMNDGNVAAGQLLTVDGAVLSVAESLTFNGAAEDDGSFRVFGGAGNDVIGGSQNADIIVGRGGFDTMTGNGGNDVFRFTAASDSTSPTPDKVMDFSAGDLIDLSRIDADTTIAGDQAFSFIGNAAFGNNAGELRYQSNGGTEWLVQGDIDGDGDADFEMILNIPIPDPITAGDFIL
ncbi:MAG: M10 family metallopeptidase C-terminal domain-containing protein, partial [Gammaproteobacteria bacterium]